MSAPTLKRVLIVDDDEALIRVMSRTLSARQPGWDITFAVGGEAALAALVERTYDAIVTDIEMPEVSGISVLAAAAHLSPGSGRIAHTGSGLMVVPHAHEVLTKPCSPGDLIDAIERALGLNN